MNFLGNLFAPDTPKREQNAFIICMVILVAFLSMSAMITSLVAQTFIWQLLILIGLFTIVTAVAGVGARFVRNGQIELGIGIAVFAVIFALPLTSLLTRGLGIYYGLAQLVGVSLIVFIFLSRRNAILLGLFNIVSAVLTATLDILGPQNRPALPMVQASLPIIIGLGLAVFAIIISREFRNFNLRVKITVGILFTGGLAIGILSLFAINRTSNIIGSLSERFETNVRLLAEEQLINTVFTESERANQFFTDVTKEIANLAQYRISLQLQQRSLNDGSYWDASTKLIRLEGGQYGNSGRDISSVFVPTTIELDDSVLNELNTSAYLDLITPQFLDQNPNVLAAYYIDPRGVVRYYPNIELAKLLPPDFDATSRPYYEITSPLFNPQRLTRWSIPYIDATGGGLVVTVASPVYYGEDFNGVFAADIQLSQITEQISFIKIGQTGYALMVDDAGRIISMPNEGYEMLSIDPSELPEEEYFKQTILGEGPLEIRSIVNRMVAGGNGLNTVNVKGVDTYIAYAPVKSNGYSIALVVPVSEMQSAINTAQEETGALVQAALRTALIILLALLLAAVIVSLSLGQYIAAPVRRLTEAASQITDGDLTVQAYSSTNDEIGTLAQAFNTMTSQLREMFDGLESNIEERTRELVEANARNERRAKQFQSIAQVARTISSTLDLNDLLHQITTVISREFGFYHVGIFLIDVAGTYAVLSAANSEGGQIMLDRGHRLKVGEVGLVGFVASTGRARVALDTGADAVFFNNPNLPETRSEISLPLHAAEKVIGVLDVQSKEANAFTQEDIAILSTLADQVSIAIQNARQNEETRKALAESDALTRQFVQSGWDRFTKREKLLGIRHTGAKATLLYPVKSQSNNDGFEPSNHPKARSKGANLTLPIQLRGEVIGSVDVHTPNNRQWDQDEMDIVTAIIERAAIAMENSRLLAESQKRAAKEKVIGEISAKISAQNDIDELLKTAARELNRNLPGTEIGIQFRREDPE